ncbi:hypothetical protein [Psychrobacter alimentarius]|uniref:hypothetical protein n=1 Tax=Psychrobacter alimentarius TaxID=261164 RepID=UPI00191B1307|nr:hypothetical protein [Psychrobacter alimentarius]
MLKLVLATLFLISFSVANADDRRNLLPEDTKEQVAKLVANNSIDTPITLGVLVANNPKFYNKREDAEKISNAILGLYDYSGYLKQFRTNMNDHDPIEKVTAPHQKAYLTCLQNNWTPEKYAEHLLTYSLIYVNSINDKELNEKLLLLNNQLIKDYYILLAQTWEHSLKAIEDNDSSLKALLTKDEQQLDKMLKNPRLLELLQNIHESPGLTFLTNYPMLTTFKFDNGILARFINGTATICTADFNKEFYKMFDRK